MFAPEPDDVADGTVVVSSEPHAARVMGTASPRSAVANRRVLKFEATANILQAKGETLESSESKLKSYQER